MIMPELTSLARLATSPRMRGSRARWVGSMLLLGGAATLSACVSVTAPDKPIVIELNINIKQEVIYRLADDARQNIERNPEIF
jgi:hypothetical protein